MPTTVTVLSHEHRAPTDDSIRVADEFREKAQAAVKEQP